MRAGGEEEGVKGTLCVWEGGRRGVGGEGGGGRGGGANRFYRICLMPKQLASSHARVFTAIQSNGNKTTHFKTNKTKQKSCPKLAKQKKKKKKKKKLFQRALV